MEILWKGTVSVEFCRIRLKLCGNCAFPQNFNTRKLGEITVFYAVYRIETSHRPNLNTLCVHYSDASIHKKNCQKSIWSEKLKKTTIKKHRFEQGYPPAPFFWSSYAPFFEIWCPFHLFIYFYNLLSLCDCLDSVPSFKHCHTLVRSCFPLTLTVTMFVKLALRARNFDEMSITNEQWVHTDQNTDFGKCLFWRTCRQTPSEFDSTLKLMIDLISGIKIRSAKTKRGIAF